MSPATPTHRQCGTMQMDERLLERDRELRRRQLRIEHQSARSIASGEDQTLWRRQKLVGASA